MTQVTDPAGLRMAALDDYLASSVEGWSTDRPTQVTLLPGGRSNVSYRLRNGTRDVVLRRPPLGNVMPSAHDMVREHRLLSGLSSVDFPVPAPLLLCEDHDVVGATFLVMEFVEGRVIATQEDAAALAPHESSAISADLVATLARLHRVDAAQAGLADLGRPEGYLGRQAKRWAEQWQRTKTRELADIDLLATWVGERAEALPSGAPWSIVHGDYRVDNVILGPTDPAIRAVLDWEMATLGDPVSDLAISLVYWSQPSDGLRHRVPVSEHVTEAHGFWSRADIVERYAEATGLPLDHLDLCLALACFKLAVIMESIHKRTLDGQQLGRASEAPGSMGEAAEALAALGVEVTRGGGVDALGR